MISKNKNKFKYLSFLSFLFAFLILFLIIWFILQIYNKLNESFDSTIQNKSTQLNNIVCLYAYYEKNELYKGNFRFFLDNGILDNIDYYIIINGDCSIDIPIRDNIVIYKRDNKGYDFGAYSYALDKIKHSHHRKYDYYFFINTSVRGPYIRPNSDSNKKWCDYFIELFNDNNNNNNNIKIVGTSINIYPYDNFNEYNFRDLYNKDGPFTHIQSMMFCIKYDYLEYLNSIAFFNENELNNVSDISYIIAHKEIGLSQHALKNGWNINCILDKYKGFDYTKIKEDFNKTSQRGDPYFNNAYFGETIDKYNTIFYKSYRLYE